MSNLAGGLIPPVEAIDHAGFLLLEVGHDGTRAKIDRLHVDVGDPVENLLIDGFERLRRMTDPGVVDQDVQPRRTSTSRPRRSRRILPPDHIRDHRYRIAVDRSLPFSRGLVAVGNDDFRALGDEFLDNAFAEARATASRSQSCLSVSWRSSLLESVQHWLSISR